MKKEIELKNSKIIIEKNGNNVEIVKIQDSAITELDLTIAEFEAVQIAYDALELLAMIERAIIELQLDNDEIEAINDLAEQLSQNNLNAGDIARIEQSINNFYRD